MVLRNRVIGPEAQQGWALPDVTPGGKQEEDEEGEEQPGDWAAVVRSGTFRQRVFNSQFGSWL